MEDFSSFVPSVHFELIPIRNLVSNQDYQRPLSQAQVESAIADFDLNQINPVKVSRRAGVNYVFNGQHTIEIVALVSGSRDTPVWCMIYEELVYEHEADIFANPTYIPDDMNPDYARYWTDERVERVLNVLEKYDIALEINARYRIPSFEIIRKAKERGIKFTFGTNNVDADFGRLEYCVDAIEQCGLTPDDLWFPSMSVRRTRPIVIYNDL